MPTIKIFTFDENVDKKELVKKIMKSGERGLEAWESKFNRFEVIVRYEFFEDVLKDIRKIFEESSEEIEALIIKSGKTRVLKRIFCYINTHFKTLEIYYGKENIVERIVNILERITGLKFKPLSLSPYSLIKLYKRYGIELRQAIFKNSEGLYYQILKGRYLERNAKFLEYLRKYGGSLKVITFKPKIKYLNGGKYFVTFNSDKGTLKFSSQENFKWRPRYEIRQITFLLSFLNGNIIKS